MGSGLLSITIKGIQFHSSFNTAHYILLLDRFVEGTSWFGRNFPATLMQHRACQHLREVKKCLDVLSQDRPIPVLHTKNQHIHTQHVQS